MRFRRRVTGRTKNLGYEKGNTLAGVVNFVALALGETPRGTCVPSRIGEVIRLMAIMGEAHAMLRDNPRIPLPKGFINSVERSRMPRPRS